MKVAIRTDASNLIGSGHLTRCRTLADELRRRDAEVRFVCRLHPGNLVPSLRDAGYAVAALPASAPGGEQASGYATWLGVAQDEDAGETIEALREFAPDCLVVDHYALDQAWERRLRPHASRMLVIDDLANRPHDCDVLLDQNWFGESTARRYDGLLPEQCQRLLGPRYAVLHPLYAQLRKRLAPREGQVRNVLVFFGGVDSHDQTIEALYALSDAACKDLAVDVVVGAMNSRVGEIGALVAKRANTRLHQRLPSLAELMAGSDLMLGAGGTTTWERCCMGLPAIVVTASENQCAATVALAVSGAQLLLGPAAEVQSGDWINAIKSLRTAPQLVKSFAAASSAITDGLGACRLAAVLSAQAPHLRIRRASHCDEAQLLEWANDPAVRSNAFSKDPIAPEAHHDWLRAKLQDPDCLLLVCEDVYELPVGQVRFDCRHGEARIDVSVDAVYRGRGVGKEMLRHALDMLRRDGRSESPVAEVLLGNDASRRLFLHSGFQPVAVHENFLRFTLAEKTQ